VHRNLDPWHCSGGFRKRAKRPEKAKTLLAADKRRQTPIEKKCLVRVDRRSSAAQIVLPDFLGSL
jgi:hypothetical protein